MFSCLKDAPRNVRKWEGGICLIDPQTEKTYSFWFGGGKIFDNVSPGCDDYVYCRIGRIEMNEIQDVDGGQLDFCRDACGWDGDIRIATQAALEFLNVGYDVVSRLRYITSWPENFADCPHITDDVEGNGVCEFDGTDCYGCTLGRSYKE